MKRNLCLLTALLMLFGLSHAQYNLTPSKLLIYQDGAQITRKGVLPFKDLKSRFRLDPQPSSEVLSFAPSEKYNILYYKYIRDSLEAVDFVRDWRDVLRANENKEVIVVFEIAEDFDEIEGRIKLMDEQNDLVMIRTPRQSDYFIPISQIRQVLVDTLAAQFIRRREAAELVEVYVDEPLPYIDVEVSYLTTGFAWHPAYRVQLSEGGAGKMKTLAILENEGADLIDTEVELSLLKLDEATREIRLDKGGVFRVGKLNLEVGDKAMLSLGEQRFTYVDRYSSRIPDLAEVGNGQKFPVDHFLLFEPALMPKAGTGALTIENEEGLILFVDQLSDSSGELSRLPMRKISGVEVTATEKPGEGGREKITIDGKNYWATPMEGEIKVRNTSTKNLLLEVDKEVKGDKPVHGQRSKLREMGVNSYEIMWEVPLKPGAKSTLLYQYKRLEPR